MLMDINLRISGTASTPQDLGSATAATPTLSTNYADLSDINNRSLVEGERLFAHFLVTEDFDAAAGEDETVEFQLVMLPKTTAAGTTFTVNAGTDVVTPATDDFPNGTCLLLTNSGGALPAGLATATHVYVVQRDAGTFKLSLTPNGTPIDITGAGTGTHTATAVPIVVASSGPIPQKMLQVGSKVTIGMNPLQGLRSAGVQISMPKQRYLHGRFVVSADLQSGMVYGDLSHSTGDEFVYYRSGIEDDNL